MGDNDPLLRYVMLNKVMSITGSLEYHVGWIDKSGNISGLKQRNKHEQRNSSMKSQL